MQTPPSAESKLLEKQIQVNKELMVKFQAVKNGLIEERKKTSELERKHTQMKSQLTQLESVIEEKEKEIIKLTKESLDIQNALSLERNKNTNKGSGLSIIGNIFQKESTDPLSEIEIKKLQKINSELKAENETIKKDFEEYKNQNIKINEEKDKQIQELKASISKTEVIINEKNKQLADDSKRIEILSQSIKEFDIEKAKFTTEFDKVNQVNNDLQKQKKFMEKELQVKNETLKEWQERVKKFEQENLDLSLKATQYKFALAESNVVIQKFKCEKIGNPNTTCEITFGPTEDSEYVMLYAEEKSKEERIKIEDVEYIKLTNQVTRGKQNELYSIADISILKNGTCLKFQLQATEELLTKLIQTYKDFLNVALKVKNNFGLNF